MIDKFCLLLNIKWVDLNVILKSMTNEKNTVKAVWKLITTTIGYITSVFGLATLFKEMAGFNEFEICLSANWLLVVAGSFLASLFYNREVTIYKGCLQDDDFQIEVQVSDLFSIGVNSYVIPTNTFFRTVMEGEYISPQSVQGAFQLRYFSKNSNQLDKLIADSLKQQGLSGEDALDSFGAVKKYPVGTVAKVDHKGKHYYFVAVADVNEFGKPVNQGYSNIDIAITGLFDAIIKFGHCDDLAMPLIGTGRAAIREATIEKVIEHTIDRFLRTHSKIAKKLTICISPKAYLEGRADLKRIGKYVDYKCEFR